MASFSIYSIIVAIGSRAPQQPTREDLREAESNMAGPYDGKGFGGGNKGGQDANLTHGKGYGPIFGGGNKGDQDASVMYGKGYADGKTHGKQRGYDEGYMKGLADGARAAQPDVAAPEKKKKKKVCPICQIPTFGLRQHAWDKHKVDIPEDKDEDEDEDA